MEDEFAQMAWNADLGLDMQTLGTVPLYTLVDRRECSTPTGTRRWEYKGKYASGETSPRLSEEAALDSFTPFNSMLFMLYGICIIRRICHPVPKRVRETNLRPTKTPSGDSPSVYLSQKTSCIPAVLGFCAVRC